MLYCIDYASTTYSMFALSLLSTTQCLHSAQCTQCFHIGSNMFGGSTGVMFYLIPKNKRTVQNSEGSGVVVRKVLYAER